jgi:hypothetical protein
LHINQHPGAAPNRHLIEVNAADLPNLQPLSFSTEIEFTLSQQDGELIRGYLEDYLQFYQNPAPKIAKRAEALMAERGETLFRGIFEGSHQGIQLWTLIEPHL